jgi:hypothetical protein
MECGPTTVQRPKFRISKSNEQTQMFHVPRARFSLQQPATGKRHSHFAAPGIGMDAKPEEFELLLPSADPSPPGQQHSRVDEDWGTNWSKSRRPSPSRSRWLCGGAAALVWIGSVALFGRVASRLEQSQSPIPTSTPNEWWTGTAIDRRLERPFNGSALSDLCNETVFIPGRYFECTDIQGSPLRWLRLAPPPWALRGLGTTSDPLGIFVVYNSSRSPQNTCGTPTSVRAQAPTVVRVPFVQTAAAEMRFRPTPFFFIVLFSGTSCTPSRLRTAQVARSTRRGVVCRSFFLVARDGSSPLSSRCQKWTRGMILVSFSVSGRGVHSFRKVGVITGGTHGLSLSMTGTDGGLKGKRSLCTAYHHSAGRPSHNTKCLPCPHRSLTQRSVVCLEGS